MDDSRAARAWEAYEVVGKEIVTYARVKKKRLASSSGLKSLGTGTSVVEAETTCTRGRPLKQGGKSRDPEYRAWGGYLKIKTLNEANYEIGKAHGGLDMSELLEEMLAGWVAQRKAEEAKKN